MSPWRETVDYFQHPLPFSRPEDLEPARRVQSLRGFLWRHGLYATDRLVTAIPCQDLFVRTLSFPFNDAAKLAQVVPFEVENLVPMPLEDLAVDSLVLPPGLSHERPPRETKGSEVLVTAAPRDKVAEHLRFLAHADIEPSGINVDAMALFSVTQYLQEEGAAVPQDLAIIDIGASKTTLCLIEGGRFAGLFAADRVYGVLPSGAGYRHSASVLWTGLMLAAVAARQPELAGLVGLTRLAMYGRQRMAATARGRPLRPLMGTIRAALMLAALVAVFVPELAGGWAAAFALALGGDVVDRVQYYMELERETPRRQMDIALAQRIGAIRGARRGGRGVRLRIVSSAS